MTSRRNPRGRRDGLLLEPLGDEMLVYDLERHQAHCLNRTAAAVWSACNGERDAGAIARHLRREIPESSSELVEVALARLARAHLLTEAGDAMPRRAALRRLSLSAALLPIVSSIVVPEPAQAASCSPAGGCCASKSECCPGLNCVGPQSPPCMAPPRDKKCQ
jgi:coenzyme PQQ synthesis protein D (PqqD)